MDSRTGQLKNIARRLMREHGLEPDLSTAALEQLRTIGAAPLARGPGIRDLRHLPWCSIDNDDSRDLDQLSVAQPQGGGGVKILVAIADVDAVVRVGAPLDEHARTNTTSVYTAAEGFPVLPARLPTHLSSLAGGPDRLAP